MKKFFKEFKEFISRGNVLDLAVGVIIGGAFTAIVTALSNGILMPLINWLLVTILGKDSLSKVYTILKRAYTTDEFGVKTLDLANSIYINWGAFIAAIINFLLIALVLFCIVKSINVAREKQEKAKKDMFAFFPTKEDKKEMKEQGINYHNPLQVKAFKDKKEQQIKEAEELAKKEAELKAEEEKKLHPSTEELLKQILEELKNK